MKPEIRNTPKRFDSEIVNVVAVSIFPGAFMNFPRESKKAKATRIERQRMARVCARRAIRTYENALYLKMRRGEKS